MSIVKDYQQFMASHAVSSVFTGEEALNADDSARFNEIIQWDAKAGRISYVSTGNSVVVTKADKPEEDTSGIHPAPAEFSAQEVAQDPILRFFHYSHLPPQLQSRSRPFCELARLIMNTLPRNAERTVALRKLLEAKDAAVRAALPVN